LFGAFSNRGKDGQTLGEVDMFSLKQQPDGELHSIWKIAIKFYLERLDLYSLIIGIAT